jgi:aminoglycoside phosphotransferase (APT) family kinase protein
VEHEQLKTACARVGLDAHGATRLSGHATGVFLLPESRVVVRIGAGPDRIRQARRAVAMARWLVSQDFPATRPIDVSQPVVVGDFAATFWTYYPPMGADRPSTADLGRLLRRLHALPRPPVRLPRYKPLAGLLAALEQASSLEMSVERWLSRRSRSLLDSYDRLDLILPPGHIHGDAYPGNLIATLEGPVLGDWDEVSVGPRELDLVNTYQGARYGRTAEELDAFGASYGYDVTSWRGFKTLREIRELHTLGAFVRRADAGDEWAAAQLAHRVKTLRTGSDELWTAAG